MQKFYVVEIVQDTSLEAAVVLDEIAAKIKLLELSWQNSVKTNHFHYGKMWFYTTYTDLARTTCFLSVSQVRTALSKLEAADYIKINRFNKKKYDKTNWYTLTDKARQYYNMYELNESEVLANTNYTQVIQEVMRYLNEQVGSDFRDINQKTIHDLTTIFLMGYEFEDVKLVIDYKKLEWGHKETLRDNLNPFTLFGHKFESYHKAALRKQKKERQTAQQSSKNSTSEIATNFDAWFERMRSLNLIGDRLDWEKLQKQTLPEEQIFLEEYKTKVGTKDGYN